jgi:hypothetical protein
VPHHPPPADEEGGCTALQTRSFDPHTAPRVFATPATGVGVPLATPLSATPNRRQRRRNVEDGSLGISAVCARIFGLRSAGSKRTKKVLEWVSGWLVGRVFREEARATE